MQFTLITEIYLPIYWLSTHVFTLTNATIVPQRWSSKKDVLQICSKHSNFIKKNHASAWVFSCKFAAYLQNTFLSGQLCGSSSVNSFVNSHKSTCAHFHNQRTQPFFWDVNFCLISFLLKVLSSSGESQKLLVALKKILIACSTVRSCAFIHHYNIKS